MVKELIYIKNVQREFQQKFGKRLVVDFPAMKDLHFAPHVHVGTDDLEDIVGEIIEKHNTTLEALRERIKGHTPAHRRARKAIVEISKTAFARRWNIQQLADYLEKHRCNIYHYAKG